MRAITPLAMTLILIGCGQPGAGNNSTFEIRVRDLGATSQMAATSQGRGAKLGDASVKASQSTPSIQKSYDLKAVPMGIGESTYHHLELTYKGTRPISYLLFHTYGPVEMEFTDCYDLQNGTKCMVEFAVYPFKVGPGKARVQIVDDGGTWLDDFELHFEGVEGEIPLVDVPHVLQEDMFLSSVPFDGLFEEPGFLPEPLAPTLPDLFDAPFVYEEPAEYTIYPNEPVRIVALLARGDTGKFEFWTDCSPLRIYDGNNTCRVRAKLRDQSIPPKHQFSYVEVRVENREGRQSARRTYLRAMPQREYVEPVY